MLLGLWCYWAIEGLDVMADRKEQNKGARSERKSIRNLVITAKYLTEDNKIALLTDIKKHVAHVSKRKGGLGR